MEIKVGQWVKQIYTNRVYRVHDIKCRICGEVIVSWETKDSMTITECQPIECLEIIEEEE